MKCYNQDTPTNAHERPSGENKMLNILHSSVNPISKRTQELSSPPFIAAIFHIQATSQYNFACVS